MVNFKTIIDKYSVFIILAALIILFGLFNPLFLSGQNIYNVISQSTYYMIAAAGLCFVMIGGGIDLSVGYQMSLVGVVTAMLMTVYGWAWWTAALVGLGLGTVLGLINGLIIVNIRVFPLIVTLATSQVFQGVSYTISQSKTFRTYPEAFRAIAKQDFLGIPLDVYLTVLCFLAVAYVFKKTYYGRHVLSVGGSEEVARLSGIRAKFVKAATYAICGFFFAVATLDMIAKANTTSSTFGPGTEFTCMTAAIIGGVSFMGGKGSIPGLAAGVLIMQILGNGMQLAGWGTYSQYIVKGLILLAAVAFDSLKNRPLIIQRVHTHPTEDKGGKENG